MQKVCKRPNCGEAFVSPDFRKVYCCRACKNKDRHRSNPFSAILSGAKRRAKKKGVAFDLTLDNLPDIPTECPALGIKLERRSNRENAPALDCIYPDKGYVKDNVWWISYRANRIKNDATLEELEAITDALRRKIQSSHELS